MEVADETIPPEGTIKYYEGVVKNELKAHGFCGFFEVPGAGYCFGGLGPFPNGVVSQLMDG